MILLNRDQSREIDKVCMETFKIPGMILMENASRSIFEIIKREIVEYDKYHYYLFCYKGNNGGDGFALARHLSSHNISVTVCFYGDKENLSGDALSNFQIIENNPAVKILMIHDYSVPKMDSHRIIVDGLLGTGLTGEVKNGLKNLIDELNQIDGIKISIDIPSGMNCNQAESPGTVFKADYTVTMAYGKIGMFLYPNREYCGKIFIAYISNPYIGETYIQNNCFFLEKKDIQLPGRFKYSHKGNYGKVAVIGGSEGMIGAGALTSMSALKTGCGLVKWVCPTNAQVFSVHSPEIMCNPFESLNDFIKEFSQWELWTDVFALGPGLEKRQGLEEFLKYIIRISEKTVILDADGINFLNRDILKKKNPNQNLVLTPHPLEFSRISGLSLKEILKNPVELWRNFCEEYAIMGVLKTVPSIICNSSGTVFINSTGNNGMSTAGSGDVLTGMIAGFAAQGLELFQALRTGVYFHGLCGDIAARESSVYSLTASDIMNKSSLAFQFLLNQ